MKTNTHKGFTLIETILYVTLLAILLGGAVVSAFSLIDGGQKNLAALRMREEAAFVEDKISWALSNATHISVSSNVLTIDRMSGDDFQATENPIQIYLDDSSLMIQRSSELPLPLNASGFPVDEFTADLSTSGQYKKIDIAFE